MNIEYLWYSIGLILIWPQKGAKSTKINFRACKFDVLQRTEIEIATFHKSINATRI